MGTLSDFVTIFFVKCYNKFTGPRSPVGNVFTDVSLTADPGIAVRSRPGPMLSWRLIMK